MATLWTKELESFHDTFKSGGLVFVSKLKPEGFF